MEQKIKEMKEIGKKHIGIFKHISDFLYDHFRTIIIILVVVLLAFNLVVNSLPTLRLPIIFFITVVFLVVIPNFIVHKGLKSITNLIQTKNLSIGQIIWNYGLAMVSAILFFAMLYGAFEYMEWGYLQYGSCNAATSFDSVINPQSGQYNPALIVSPLNRVYFSSITFFTVGYGDICPMGYTKVIAVLNALAGSLINILVISIAVGQYLNSGSGNGNGKT